MENLNNKTLYDVIVIGGGPAGLTAAIYLARAKYRVLVLEKEKFGGQITITHEVVNFPGISKISGEDLTENMRRQAEAFGAEFMLAEAEGLDIKDDIKMLKTSRGELYCLGLLIATGAHPRVVGFKGEEQFKGRGVAYCATCDGEFFTGKEVFVIGGGFAAAEESVFLTKFASHVTILIRSEDFTCAASVADQAKNNEKITVIYNVEVEEVSGENGLNYIRYKNIKTGKTTEYRANNGDSFGVFVFAGYAPQTSLFKGILKLNDMGYIITDSNQKTSQNGVYAAGDVCIKSLRQVVTATGDGALAATELEKYVAEIQRKTGLRPIRPEEKTKEQNTVIKNDENSADDGGVFSPQIKEQLNGVFAKMQKNIILKLYLDNRQISAELQNFITNLASLTNKLEVLVAKQEEGLREAPCVKVCLEDGTETGVAFHGVPSGHEFTSFVLGLYNAAGPGQAIDAEVLNSIKAINKKVNLQVLVSLSCTMCPDLVVACQKIAAESNNVSAEVYDIFHFEELKNKYNVLSVPCLVINGDKVSFGKKNIKQVLELIN